MQALIVLAHAGGAETEGSTAVFTVMLISVLSTVWIALGIVCWVFWRAKRRDDEAKKESEWGNVLSS